MPIVSLSLNEKILEDIDALEKSLGFTGRSEVMRAAIRHFITEEQGANALKGKIHSVILAMHAEKAEDVLTGMTHNFDDIIVTQVHNNLENDKCLETFIVFGEAGRVKTMFKTFQANKKVDYVKLLVI